MTISGWPTQLSLPASLQARGVQGWLVQLACSPELLVELRTLLAPDELERADRFLVDNPRRNYIVCRATLRLLLAQQLNLPPAKVSFCYSAKGKPALDECHASATTFNLSHSGDFGLIAIGTSAVIGVDIERVEEKRDLIQIGRACWSPEEQEAMNRAPSSRKASIFYTIWTRKEAVLKASGDGIGTRLQALDVSAQVDGNSTEGIPVQLEGRLWRVFDIHPAPGYAAAVAISESLS